MILLLLLPPPPPPPPTTTTTTDDDNTRRTIITMIIMKKERRDSRFQLSPDDAWNCLQHERSSGPGAIVLKSRANTSGAYHVQHTVYHVVQSDSSAFKLDRVDTALVFSEYRWLKPLVDEGGEETGVPEEKPPTTSYRNATD